MGPPRAAFGLVCCTFVVLMGATWFRHTDVGDAQLYQVIARQMVRSGDWFSLEYLGKPFFDHLPFGLWPIAAAQRFHEGAVIPLHALFSLLTLALVGVLGQRVSGPWAALASMFVLATSQYYFFQTSYPTLDPLLLLLTTASVVPLVTARTSARDWGVAWLFAALAVAVKGPFGLLPLAGVLGARVLVDRSGRHAGWGGLVFVSATVPVALFLWLRPEWGEGYGARQLLASATGQRTDGGAGLLLALRFLGERYWPWLPLLALGLAGASGRFASFTPTDVHACRTWLVACASIVLGLSLPARKIWHHTLVAYPLLSLLIGAALSPFLARWFGDARGRKRLLTGLGVATALSIGAVWGGVDRLLMARPCVLVTDFAVELRRVRAGEVVPVVSAREEWDMLSALAFELDVRPERAAGWEGVTAPLVLATDDAWQSAPAGWRPLKQARGWVVALRPAGETAPGAP